MTTLEKRTVPELRSLAKQRGLTGYSKMTKSSLISALRTGHKSASRKSASRKITSRKSASRKSATRATRKSASRKSASRKIASRKSVSRATRKSAHGHNIDITGRIRMSEFVRSIKSSDVPSKVPSSLPNITNVLYMFYTRRVNYIKKSGDQLEWAKHDLPDKVVSDATSMIIAKDIAPKIFELFSAYPREHPQHIGTLSGALFHLVDFMKVPDLFQWFEDDYYNLITNTPFMTLEIDLINAYVADGGYKHMMTLRNTAGRNPDEYIDIQ